MRSEDMKSDATKVQQQRHSASEGTVTIYLSKRIAEHCIKLGRLPRRLVLSRSV